MNQARGGGGAVRHTNHTHYVSVYFNRTIIRDQQHTCTQTNFQVYFNAVILEEIVFDGHQRCENLDAHC